MAAFVMGAMPGPASAQTCGTDPGCFDDETDFLSAVTGVQSESFEDLTEASGAMKTRKLESSRCGAMLRYNEPAP